MIQDYEDIKEEEISESPVAKNEEQTVVTSVVPLSQYVTTSPTQPAPKRIRTSSPCRSTTTVTLAGAPRTPLRNHASMQQFRAVGVPKGGLVQTVSSPTTVVGQPIAPQVRSISASSLQSLAAALGMQQGSSHQSSTISDILSLSGISVSADGTRLVLTENPTACTAPATVATPSSIVTQASPSLQHRLIVNNESALAVLGKEVTNVLRQQVPVTTAANVASGDITSVHSYSLASVPCSSTSSCSIPQKSDVKLVSTPCTVSTTLEVLRTPVKRPRTVLQQPGDINNVHNIVSEVSLCISRFNKLMSNIQDIAASTTASSSIPGSLSPRPKKTKCEKLSPVSVEYNLKRHRAVSILTRKLNLLRIKYYKLLTEFFFLKSGGNMMDYLSWQKKPPTTLIDYLRKHLLNNGGDHEMKLMLEIVSSVPFLSSSVPFSTAILPGMKREPVAQNTVSGNVISSHGAASLARSLPVSQVAGVLRSPSNASLCVASTTVTKSLKQPVVTPRLVPKHNSLSSVYESSIGSQEEIVERAKQEAYVMQRIGDLRREGLWSLKRLPKLQEPSRSKAQWDYLLEEMAWLATDFAQERKWKKAAAKKCSRMIIKYFQEKEMKVEKAEKEVQTRLRRIASFMAKEIRNFWANIEKLVEYKQQTWLDAKKKKVLDSHLNFIVDQTEKYSSWLTQGLNRKIIESNGTSRASSPTLESLPSRRKSQDSDFCSESDESDNEETIEKEEENQNDDDEAEEIKLLQEESEIPFEDLLQTLPKEVLDKPAPLLGDLETELPKDDSDDDFQAPSSEDNDDEETIMEQEEKEKDTNYEEELQELQEQNEVPIEELYEKYKDCVDEFEMSDAESPSNGGDEDEDEDDLSEVDEDETDGHTLLDEESFGTSMEVQQPEENSDMFGTGKKNPSKEITDIAATAESFQPTGNTLSTTEVCTKVPFLLKHKLREYQHIGLDWLNALHDKKLNGILADEMGLGKTIQTISLLAHLACEKGIWGPHLIVVPTSVMLNWEMEFKKWCPAFKILTYYGSPKERKQKRIGWTKYNSFHVCITSYKLVVQDHTSFRRKKWIYLILDEAQHIKNFKSQRWQMLLNFQSTHRLLLTGTPLQNDLMELWSLMHFLMPHVFRSHRDFKEWFVNPVSGMIEGNHEYNESLIKRLHKVLRPFLLRRLKSEVEKQLPKKYEHVVMCRLSKRQRYLYDDFMSQTKTKETLATGNFMSVINVLMQLRKVCNHPNMFEPRPIVSPFTMPALTYNTASQVWDALDYDPFRHVSLLALNLLIADIELCVTAFAAHRTKSFQLKPGMIEVIDSTEVQKIQIPPGKIKMMITGAQLPQLVPGNVLPHGRPAAAAIPRTPPNLNVLRPPVPFNTTIPNQRYMMLPGQQQHAVPASRLASPVAAVSGQQVVSQPTPTQSGEYTLQLLQQPSGGMPVAQLTSVANQVVTSTPFTVQIPAGSRMPVSIGRLVQTATGQHLILTPSVPTPATDLQTSTPSVSTTVSYSPVVQNSLASVVPTSSSPNIATATVLPQVQKIPPTAVIPPIVATFTRPQTITPLTTTIVSSQHTYNKPIGRVAPLNVHPPVSSSMTSGLGNPSQVGTKSPVVHSVTKPQIKPKLEVPATARAATKRESIFYLESLLARQAEAKRAKLKLIAQINPLRCAPCPVYGSDLIEAVTVTDSVQHSFHGAYWGRRGYLNCLNAPFMEKRPRSVSHFTRYLTEIVLTPEAHLEALKEIIRRFVFITPAVTAPSIQLHVSHPGPSKLNEERLRATEIRSKISDSFNFLHPIISNSVTQFPELRLIEYDCGKLQRLSELLYELKTGHHRVLIFTQMTRMLDILEQFLSYHGHTYLRLDGTTKVEMRHALMERFNADKKIFCFILSTRSGGIGVNLTGADTVIFYDSDWNPTMDAQAQDRCHRIGQTRDVHIYRLISERTVEENILKKANQKRILGDLAIEGGNFTTAFFKTTTLEELFGISKQEELIKNEVTATSPEDTPMESPSAEDTENYSQVQLEQALGMAEEELDLEAAKVAKDEAAAEFAEFDESIPFDNDSRDMEEKSPAEEELDRIMEQLSPIERYAVRFYESLQEPISLEQLKQAEEEIEAQKRDWELGRLKALQQEQERRAKPDHMLSSNDPLLCYTRQSVLNQVAKSNSPSKCKKRNMVQKPRTKPKRRSQRLTERERKSLSDNDESNDSQNSNDIKRKNEISQKRPIRKKINSIYEQANGSVKDNVNMSRCNSAVKARLKVSSDKLDGKTAKIIQSPVIVKPFANPNLVIRTRRASAIEAEEKKSESESERSISSPRSVENSFNMLKNSSLLDISIESLPGGDAITKDVLNSSCVSEELSSDVHEISI